MRRWGGSNNTSQRTRSHYPTNIIQYKTTAHTHAEYAHQRFINTTPLYGRLQFHIEFERSCKISGPSF
ncbi:ORF142 [Cydia pomonella granulovirus]|uniref:ORF142 n=2 Tax=Cydia pomonella granulosis virus TaxID=28289 RepID=Q91ER3_GVCPM|nr:ORF142 [Cydia pomonella granulovirus]AAK70802.1 ORF142 [Cydia pomonella granulovirus]AIU36788.1 ORF142 [Cydia pomonella granulovirus]AIU37067.1 ORF142 [Cydia pomonella granulovirus]AIU37209.1 ORF142 [Cydia pomonella granulovirus]AIU37347.1 ORF142 [Cydia pomonella granulovirus]